MNLVWQEQLRTPTALREMVREATQALVSMDAGRLEELAQCCSDLNRELQQGRESRSIPKPEQASDWKDVLDALIAAPGDMELLQLVLLETRANLAVLSRLRVSGVRAHLGYGQDEAEKGTELVGPGRRLDDGNH